MPAAKVINDEAAEGQGTQGVDFVHPGGPLSLWSYGDNVVFQIVSKPDTTDPEAGFNHMEGGRISGNEHHVINAGPGVYSAYVAEAGAENANLYMDA